MIIDEKPLFRIYLSGLPYIILTPSLLFYFGLIFNNVYLNLSLFILGYYFLPCSCFWIFDYFNLFKNNCKYSLVLKYKFNKFIRIIRKL